MAGGGMLRRLMHLAAQRLRVLPRDDLPSPTPPPPPLSAAGISIDASSPAQVPSPAQVSSLDMSFEVDWSAISVEGLNLAFRELVFSMAGLPMPVSSTGTVTRQRSKLNGWWRSDVSLQQLYLSRELREGAVSGFLVRGVIYDMSALARPNVPSAKKKDNAGRDWSNVMYSNLDLSSKVGKVEDVSAMDVMEKLGLKGVAGLKDRVGDAPFMARKKKLEQRQALEEVLGSGDSIRVKYADKLRHKKMLADARREQGKLGVLPTASPGIKGLESSVAAIPGSPALVRYLQERGVVQALLARGPAKDLTSLMDQLGNFQFEDVKQLQDGDLSEGLLSSICAEWHLPSKQVMVVVSADCQSEKLLKTVADKGFFICRIRGDWQPSRGTMSNESSEGALKLDPQKQKGLASWFNKLAEGTLHLDEQNGDQAKKKDPVHFNVMDMTELKWVIEDLNGVSYRPSTIVRGFQ